MQPRSPFRYLSGYAERLTAPVRAMIADGTLAERLLARYPQRHDVRTDRALYDYVGELKARYLRSAEPLSKVAYDNRLHVIQHALGTHTAISRVQGQKLKAKREIRVAGVFREAPPEFLRMIVVHELAHLKERDHDKAFYQLCSYMEPAYHQLEFDLRTYLVLLEATGVRPWGGEDTPGVA
ncbi:YgjP-like metallopeptidase domain-containing protein [Niveibacterium sp.]|uniref:M48 family metallopeptidase n=1 Tax=Niveibacterium sp. TaxID=2017444 RepID=UPI0035B30A8D